MEDRETWIEVLRLLKDQGFWIVSQDRSTGVVVISVRSLDN